MTRIVEFVMNIPSISAGQGRESVGVMETGLIEYYFSILLKIYGQTDFLKQTFEL